MRTDPREYRGGGRSTHNFAWSGGGKAFRVLCYENPGNKSQVVAEADIMGGGFGCGTAPARAGGQLLPEPSGHLQRPGGSRVSTGKPDGWRPDDLYAPECFQRHHRILLSDRPRTDTATGPGGAVAAQGLLPGAAAALPGEPVCGRRRYRGGPELDRGPADGWNLCGSGDL